MAARALFVGSLALFVFSIAVLPGDAARADPPAGTAPRLRVYDIRIVRVVTAAPAGVEAACPFLTGDATTTRMGWADILETLKKRGSTRVLMDQRVTAQDGIRAKVSQERQVPVVMLQSKTLNGENHAATRQRTGCTVDLIVGGGVMDYKPLIRGVTDGAAPGATGQTEMVISWNGTHPALDGETLVLTHRQQTLDTGAKNATGVEHYCFIRGRTAAR